MAILYIRYPHTGNGGYTSGVEVTITMAANSLLQGKPLLRMMRGRLRHNNNFTHFPLNNKNDNNKNNKSCLYCINTLYAFWTSLFLA